MKLFRIALIASLTAFSGHSMAAVQGTLSATESEGQADINISKDNAVMISMIDDINLGNFGNLSETLTGDDDVCVFSSTGGYSITITSGNGSFDLSDDYNRHTLRS